MDVNTNRSELFGNEYNASRAASRRDGRPLEEGDLRARVQRLGLQHQAFRRFLADQIAVDEMGLEVMDHLMSSGPSNPTALARELDISTAAMSLVLQRLEAAGHVRRERHPTDGRRQVVTAADASIKRAYSYVLPMATGIDQLVATMNDEERRVASAFLDGVIAAYESAMD
ncbi:MarR family winged helix-turn-helix transcriptional regulator [Cryobacterium sp. AP23]